MEKYLRKRIQCALAACLACFLVFSLALPIKAEEDKNAYSLPDDLSIKAEGVYLVNGDSGVVVYEKNADKQFSSASLAKMMTCIIAVEQTEDLDAPTMEARSWVYDELYGKNASHADIRRGENLSMRELLYAMLLPSANEAALITADYLSGQYYKNFIFLMNKKAEALGCTDTVFVDPGGLSQENKTTAKDMYLIVKEFMSHEELVKIASAPVYEMAAHEQHDAPYNILATNRLMEPTDPYANAFPSVKGAVKAGKTGSLGDWQNFASMAEKNDETYYCVILHSPNEADKVAGEGATAFRPALYETSALYDWVFRTFSVKPALDISRPITEVKVKHSADTDSVQLLPTDSLNTVLPKDGTGETTLEFDLPEYLEAPVKEGQNVGTVTLLIEGQNLGTVELVAAENIKRNNMLFLINKFKGLFSWTVIKILLLAVLLIIGGYSLLLYYAKKKQTGGKGTARLSNEQTSQVPQKKRSEAPAQSPSSSRAMAPEKEGINRRQVNMRSRQGERSVGNTMQKGTKQFFDFDKEEGTDER